MKKNKTATTVVSTVSTKRLVENLNKDPQMSILGFEVCLTKRYTTSNWNVARTLSLKGTNISIFIFNDWVILSHLFKIWNETINFKLDVSDKKNIYNWNFSESTLILRECLQELACSKKIEFSDFINSCSINIDVDTDY